MPETPSSQNIPATNLAPFSLLQSFLVDWHHYMIALAAAIVELAGLKVTIQKLSLSDWPIYLLASVPPSIVFICKTVPRLREKHRQNILVLAAQHVEPASLGNGDDSAYFLIGPYPEERHSRYRRADAMHKIALRWVRESREPILILSGLSGSGKSSLIRAYVLPELRGGSVSYSVLYIRSYSNPLDELRRQLTSDWNHPPDELDGLTLLALLKRSLLRLKRNDSSRRLIVIFDQFEEFVVFNTENGQNGINMKAFLADVRAQPPADCSFLFVVRSDYKSLLTTIGLPLLNERSNWLEVPAFIYADAADFLTAPESRLIVSPGRLRSVLTEAAAVDGTRGLIRPIILNMLGVVLKRIANSPSAEKSAPTLLADDLRSVVNEPRHRVVARAILPHLLSDADTKRPRTLGQLHDATGINPYAIYSCLLDIAHAGYVHEVNHSESLTESLWEISHDFVARLLGPVLKTPFQNRWSKLFAYLYPSSLAFSVIVAILTPLLIPIIQRYNAETTLRERYQFMLHITNHKYSATQVVNEDKDLAQAFTLLARLNPVTVLNLSSSTNLISLKGIEQLQDLTSLNLESCYRLTDLSGVNRLTQLQTLDLQRCSALTSLDGLKGSLGPQAIELNNCWNLESLNGLQNLERLQSLDLEGCLRLTNIDALQNLTGLQDLNLNGCFKLTDIDVIQNIPNVQSLSMIGWRQLINTQCLQKLHDLEVLDLEDCNNLKNLDGLQGAKYLRRLVLNNCINLVDISSLGELTDLQTLSLSDCHSIKSVQSLVKARALTDLNVSRCISLVDITALNGLNNLQSLDLSGCSSLMEFTVIRNLKSLETLNLSGNPRLTDMSMVQNLSGLQHLQMDRCDSLVSLDGISSVKHLKTLSIGNCKGLSTLSGFNNLPDIETVTFDKCSSLANLNGIEHLPRLQKLILSECKNLTSIEGVANVSNLTEVNLFGCDKLESIEALSQCHLLQSIDLRQIKTLKISDVARLKAELPKANIQISEEFYQ